MRAFLMKDSIFTLIYAFFYHLCIAAPILGLAFLPGMGLKMLLFAVSLVAALVIIHHFPQKKFERRYLTILYSGCMSLKIFVMSCLLTVVLLIVFFLFNSVFWPYLVAGVVWFVLLEAILFWNGMIRVFLSSVQLGVTLRVVAALCGWIPVVNIVLLLKVIEVVEKELAFEYQKDLLIDVAVESQECRTKYPLLLVHGVFFRDISYLNYWGRVPYFLKQRGANIYYGNQESAQSVEYCGQQLAQRIKQLVEETGCEKVNLIAHSKGGLDSRFAVANGEISQYVASLTTINTPHQGCIFANYLLKKAPKKLVNQVEKMYNLAFQKLGDQQPNFLAAVNDLTDESCQKLNQKMPNQPEVYYQSITSYVRKASSGKFPLNMFYPIVKHFDGRNDGLVSVASASFFNETTVIDPPGKRGISHADMIDLNRENIDGFDVREFYKELIIELKMKGF
ncbi:alpha/beta fold hydrolase [Enterococcus sp. AZ109]|uniref:esterase/lipase family protein n=1 Tax=Enterococcus sp. AZ109 TaxID=2774634 RepID=UPI003F2859F3